MIAGQLEIQLMADIARLKQDMESAKTVVGGAMAQIEKSVGAARTAILGLAAGLAAGLSIRAFQQIIKGSIDSAAALNDLSIQTGATVEALSGLASVGKYSDVSAQQIAASMNMLAKNMAGATEESKGAGKALEALGINFDQFKKLSPEQQMQTVAKSMGQFEDGAGKAAVAMALYGKEGAKMLPFLKDLADLGGIQAKVTAEQAAAADNFSDNLTRLQGSGDAWKKELAAGMIPALNDAVQAFIDVTNGSGGLRDEVRKLSKDGSIAEWTRNAIAGLTYVADAAEGAWRVMKTVGMGLGGLAAAAVALVNRDWAGVKNVLSNLGDDLQKTWSDQTLGQRLRARMADIKKVGDVAQEAKPKLDFTNVLGKDGGSAGGGRAAASEYDRLIKSIREKISVQQLEMASDQALTDGQKEAAKIMEGLRSGTLTLTDAQKKNVTAALELLIAEEKGVETKKAMAKAASDLVAVSAKELKSVEDQLEKQREHNEQIGLSKEAIERLTAAKIDLEAAADRELATNMRAAADYAGPLHDAYLQYAADLEKAAAAKNALAEEKRSGAAKEFALEEAKKAQEEWKRTSETIERSLTDALMRGFESGKGFASNFKDTIVNMFKTMVLRPIVQGIVQPVAGSITGALMGGGGGGTLGTLSNGMSLFNTASNAAGLYNGAMGLIGGAGAMGAIGATGVTAGTLGAASGLSLAGAGTGLGLTAGGLGTASGLSLVGSGSGIGLTAASGTIAEGALGTAISGAGGATAAGGLSAGLAAIPGWGWAAMAAIAASQLLKGGETRYGGGYDVINGKTVLGGGPSGGEIQGDQVRQSIQFAYDGLAKTLKDLGSNATIGRFTAGLESSKNDKGATFAGGIINGQQFGSTYETTIYNQSLTQEQAFAQFSQKLQQSVLLALRQAGDIPKTIIDQLNAANIEKLSMDQANALLQSIDAQITAVKSFQTAVDSLPFENLKNLGFDAASGLIAAAGGLDKLSAGLSTYYDKFFTAEEKTANTTKQVTEALASLGFDHLPKTREEFRAMVDSVKDLDTAAGQAAYVGLLNLSGALDSLLPALQETANAAAEMAKASAKSAAEFAMLQVDAAFSALQRSVDAERKRITADYNDAIKLVNDRIKDVTGSIGKLSSLSSSLRSTVDRMRMPNTLGADRAAAKAQITAALAIARAGGALPDADSLASALDVVSQPSEQLYATFLDYQRDFLSTKSNISELAGLTDTQLSVEEKTLKALELQQQTVEQGYQAELARLDGILSAAQAQIDALNGINTSVLSLAATQQAFNGSVSAAKTNPIIAATPQITDAYQSSLGRNAAGFEVDYWRDKVAGGMSAAEVVSSITNSREAQIVDLYKTVLKRDPDQAGLQFQYDSGLSIDQIKANILGSDEYKNMPKFADGGWHAGGWRLVGERGPELEYTPPARIFSASQTTSMLNGGGNAELVAAVGRLESRLARIETNTESGAASSKKTADTFERVTRGGEAMVTTT